MGNCMPNNKLLGRSNRFSRMLKKTYEKKKKPPCHYIHDLISDKKIKEAPILNLENNPMYINRIKGSRKHSFEHTTYSDNSKASKN